MTAQRAFKINNLYFQEAIKMKKALMTMTAAALILSMAACSGNANSGKTTSGTTTAAAQTEAVQSTDQQSGASGTSVFNEENGVLTYLDTEHAPFDGTGLKITINKSAGTVNFVKTDLSGKETVEYYTFDFNTNTVEQYYYVSMMGTGFYYTFDLNADEIVKIENSEHEDSTQSTKDNGRYDSANERLRSDVKALQTYFTEQYGTEMSDMVEKSAAAPQDKSDTASSEEYGTVVIENGDRTVTFTSMPQKVLCANLYAAENMVMLGLEDHIVGKNVHTNPAEVPLPELADKFENIPEIERSLENAVALGTDLVIGQISTFKDTAWGSFEQLESNGINCLTITGTIVPDETVEHIYIDIENLGKIFKVEDKAAEVIAQIKSDIADTNAKVADIAESDKLSVFVLDSFNGNEIYTTSSGLQSNLIELAGGINCTKGMADSRWFNTSVETLVDTNPDVIIINDYGKQTVEEKRSFAFDNPALADVPAVKNNRVLVIPLVEVMQDVRAATACRKIAEYLYPDRF